MKYLQVPFTLILINYAKDISSAVVFQDKLWEDYLNFLPNSYSVDTKRNPCLRICSNISLTCEYDLILENYETMSRACHQCPFVSKDCHAEDCIPANGIQHSVFSINRQLPGTPIEVCEGDEIIVNVHNNYVTDATTLHWHGQHQRYSPYMDGVPYLTQCPIQAGSSFQYRWSANNPGTHFYHSHSGMHRAEGSFGPLIVRTGSDQLAHLYDYDLPLHTISVSDWTRKSALDKLLDHIHNSGNGDVDTLLVNGYGRFEKFSNNQNDTVFQTPVAEFVVEKGKRFRFRYINGGSLNCPIQLSIDNHKLQVISTDGSDIDPVEIDVLTSYSGERFDFVVNANQEPGVYWIRFVGLMNCASGTEKAYQIAILRYRGQEEQYPSGDEPNYDNSIRDGIELNPVNIGDSSDSLKVITNLTTPTTLDSVLTGQPDIQYYAAYDFTEVLNPNFNKPSVYSGTTVVDPRQQFKTPQINHITMAFPPFPLLSSKHKVNETLFCNETTVQNCEKEFCACVHVIKVTLNSSVEIVLVDEGFAYNTNHPFHLHGNSFAVVAIGKIGDSVRADTVRKLDEDGKIVRNLKNPPIKDTVTVPDGGYTIIRFQAKNPGYWLFHCHVDYHAFLGMAVVFKVGEDSDYVGSPNNFPTCGNYPDESV